MRLVEIDGKYVNPDQVLFVAPHPPIDTMIHFASNYDLIVEVPTSRVAALLVEDR